jgi:uncharacterized protein (TIGR02996 family)
VSYAALLQAILDTPDDDFPRLVMADWLEENDQPERSEFIRVQVELAGLREPPRSTRTVADGWQPEDGHPSLAMQQAAAPYWALKRCEMELWPRLFRLFDVGIVPDTPMLLYDDEPSLLIRRDRLTVRVYPRRGFVATIRLPLAAWLAHGEALVRAHPLERVEVSDREPVALSGQRFAWLSDDVPGAGQQSKLPPSLWAHMPQGDVAGLRDGGRCRVWDSKEKALDALSTACLTWARRPVLVCPTEFGPVDFEPLFPLA